MRKKSHSLSLYVYRTVIKYSNVGKRKTCVDSQTTLHPRPSFGRRRVATRSTTRGGGARGVARQGGSLAVELLGRLSRLEHLVRVRV